LDTQKENSFYKITMASDKMFEWVGLPEVLNFVVDQFFNFSAQLMKHFMFLTSYY